MWWPAGLSRRVLRQVFPVFDIPSWVVRLIVLLIVLGFPVALVLSWFFDLTRYGIVRTPDLDGRNIKIVQSGPDSSRADAAEKSIAVLPFDNQNCDPDIDYLSDGIPESIIHSLSQLPQLRVMARSTVFSYKGKDVDPRKVGNDLAVVTVLMGRLIQQGDNLAIRIELVNVADGSELWGEQYNRKLADVFAVQEEIAKEISEAALEADRCRATTACEATHGEPQSFSVLHPRSVDQPTSHSGGSADGHPLL